jgi:hypothetical protein
MQGQRQRPEHLRLPSSGKEYDAQVDAAMQTMRFKVKTPK